MSRSRHCSDQLRVVTKHRVEARDRSVGWHVHHEHELNWGANGRRVVETEGTLWTLPPTVGLLVPVGVRHAGFIAADVSHYWSFIDPARFGHPWTEPTPIAIPPVVRELLLHLRSLPGDAPERPDLERTVVSLLEPVSTAGVPLPMPTDPRARAVAIAVGADPADHRTTGQWAREVGISARTLDRLFLDQTRTTFTQWRIQARIRAAILLLAGGQSATSVAHQVGYQTPSAFVRVFKQTTGTTPRAYAAALREDDKP